MFDQRVIGGILGFVVGDALGVPVEFERREALQQHPVAGMRGYGSYDQPAGGSRGVSPESVGGSQRPQGGGGHPEGGSGRYIRLL